MKLIHPPLSDKDRAVLLAFFQRNPAHKVAR